MAALAVAAAGTAARAQDARSAVAAHPGGGPGLVEAVARTLAARPETADDFCALAATGTRTVRGAIGAGMAQGVRLLYSTNQIPSAWLVHWTACAARGCRNAPAASYAAAMGRDSCRLALQCPAPFGPAPQTGSRRLRSGMTPLGIGGGSPGLASPN